MLYSYKQTFCISDGLFNGIRKKKFQVNLNNKYNIVVLGISKRSLWPIKIKFKSIYCVILYGLNDIRIILQIIQHVQQLESPKYG